MRKFDKHNDQQNLTRISSALLPFEHTTRLAKGRMRVQRHLIRVFPNVEEMRVQRHLIRVFPNVEESWLSNPR
jgi:hypothetical protein